MGQRQLVLLLCGLMTVITVRMTSACWKCYHANQMSNYEKFYQAEFAMRVHVWGRISAAPRGYRVYEISVEEQPFKTKNVKQYQDRVYTPASLRRCGVRLQPGVDYIITGNYRPGPGGVYELEIDECGWVDEWTSVEGEELDWLRMQRRRPRRQRPSSRRTPVDLGTQIQGAVGPYNQNQGPMDPYNQNQGTMDPYSQNQRPVDPYNQNQGPVDPYNQNQTPLDPYRTSPRRVDPYRQAQNNAIPNRLDRGNFRQIQPTPMGQMGTMLG